MKKITLFTFFLSLCINAQTDQLEPSDLETQVYNFEKSGNINCLDYANTLNNLAMKYFQMGKYDGAESLYLKSLKSKKKILGINTLEYANTLNNLAYLYSEQGKYSESEKLYIESLDIYKKIVGEKNLNYATLINNLGLFYENIGNYKKAEQLILKGLEIRKELLGIKHPDYAASLNNIASLYYDQDDYSKAEPLLIESSEINKNIYGENDDKYLTSLNNLAQLYTHEGKYFKAEYLFIQVLEKRKDLFGEKHPDYATSLNDLAGLYDDEGKYKEAESLYLKAIEIRKEVLGDKNPDYTASLNNLAQLLYNQGRYSEAEALYVEAIKIKKEVLGKKNISYATSLSNLAILYGDQGKYYDAEKLFIEALEITKDVLGDEHSDYALRIDNLACLYEEQGKYSKAETLFILALDIRKKIFGEKHPDYATSLNNLASSYQDQGKFYEAEPLYLKSLDIIKEILGENHPTYLLYLNNLAELYCDLGRFSEAEPFYLKVINLRKKTLGENHPDYASSLNSLASFYFQQKKYDNSLPLYLEALKIIKQNFGENNQKYALIISNIAQLYKRQNNNIDAEYLLLKSLKIRKEILGENHPDYLSNLYEIADFYRVIDSNSKASDYFELFISKNKIIMSNDLYGLKENDFYKYLNFKENYLKFPLSFLHDFPTDFPKINTSCYETELIIKNLTLRNQQRIKNAIQKSGNQQLLNKYNQFLFNKLELNKLNELQLNELPSNYPLLVKETDLLESELAKGSTTFSDFKKVFNLSLKDVKDKLKKHDILIDIVNFNYFNEKLTNHIIYGAFIITKNTLTPKYIALFEEEELEILLSKNKIQQNINNQYKDKNITNLFLKPLEKELEGINTIYLSPSGLGHQIDFTALPINSTLNFGEKYKLHILSSPAELIDYKVATIDKKSKNELLLYGGIDYNKSDGNANLIVNENSMPLNEDFIDSSKRSGIEMLPGTLKEIDVINTNANKSGFSCKIFKESEASEESIKALDGRTTPYVLHLATHGFFFPDPIQQISKELISSVGKSKIYMASDDPMMRSGLLLAGAKNYWGKSNQNYSIEDGILTASEISNLDLSACQLVVLSACETGLGEVKGSEGVFGLQRAFKMAGVKNIIMSLWKVPDAQTAELFDVFYRECFTGKTIHEAFQSTQSQMKAKYSPYYWAGFVLLE